VLLINAALPLLFLSDTSAGSLHDKRIADTTPYPLPAGSRLLQDRGFLAFTLDHVEIIMPPKKPRGRALTRAQKAATRRIARRRVRIEHVNSRVKRCRIVHDTSRWRKAGVRDLVMEVCCGRPNFRVRLIPWQPMVNRDKLSYDFAMNPVHEPPEPTWLHAEESRALHTGYLEII
jgi:DDE superfamily endonuclease